MALNMQAPEVEDLRTKPKKPTGFQKNRIFKWDIFIMVKRQSYPMKTVL